MVVYQQYVTDIIANVKKALTNVDPTPFFAKYGDNAWAAVKEYQAAQVAHASAPVIKKYNRSPGRCRRLHGQYDLRDPRIGPPGPRVWARRSTLDPTAGWRRHAARHRRASRSGRMPVGP